MADLDVDVVAQLQRLYQDAYNRIMGEHEPWEGHTTFVVRLWDGMDGTWTDCTAPMTLFDALHEWLARTSFGTEKISFQEIDYYRVFPSSVRMHYSGGREMFRQEA